MSPVCIQWTQDLSQITESCTERDKFKCEKYRGITLLDYNRCFGP